MKAQLTESRAFWCYRRVCPICSWPFWARKWDVDTGRGGTYCCHDCGSQARRDVFTYEEYKARGGRRKNKQAWCRDMVGRALRSGRLVKESCRDCENADVEAHHVDYDRPLDIVWLCKSHHDKIRGIGPLAEDDDYVF